MRKIRTEDAVGLALCHDMTKVVPGKFKGIAFKRGHIIREEDIPELLNMGKEHIYIWEETDGEIHEDHAALRMAAAAAGENIEYTEPEEGKCLLKAKQKGLFQLQSDLLAAINAIEDVTIPCLPNDYRVEPGQKVAAARVVPLVTKERNVIEVERLCREQGPVFRVKPYKKLNVGVVITGGEVFKGRIEDKFGPVIEKKMSYFEAPIIFKQYCPDEMASIKMAVLQAQGAGAELILVTGGMSVDPDDLTPGAIKSAGAEILSHGLPVQPGNMFMVAYLGEIPVFGVPGAAIYFPATVLDVLLPKVLVGDKLEKEELLKMGEGGLCAGCPACHYPNCHFGR